MALATICQTPDAIFNTHIDKNVITIEVRVPFDLDLSEEEASTLEANLHNAMELVLAKYF